MKPTHQHKTEKLWSVAWLNAKDSPIPIWVCKRFHDIDGSGDRYSTQFPTAKLGDWIVGILDREQLFAVSVMNSDDFHKHWKALALALVCVSLLTSCRFPGVDQHEGHNYEPNPWHVPGGDE